MTRAGWVLAVAALALPLAIGGFRAPAAAATGGPAYAALGDSYSSGIGSGNEDGTDCRRSANAYPSVFVRGNSYTLSDFAACSGATIPNVEQSQLGGVASARLVTITIGGNDARFRDIVVDCLRPWSKCRDDYPDEDQRIDALEGPLHRLYTEIVAAAPSADLRVLTYPQIFRRDTTCSSTVTLSRADVDWFHEEYARMDAVIRRAAGGVSRTEVLDVEGAFAGHELCSAQEWAFGGRWRDRYSSFHPDPLGHAALAAALRAAAG